MEKKSIQRLIEAALKARLKAVAPFSRFKVGAALLTRRGKIIAGANVESASLGLTCCAERVALFKALTDGHKDFLAMAIASRWPEGAMPCGACRQLLAEYAPKAVLFIVDSARPARARETSLARLLPEPFHSYRPAAKKKPR